MRVVPTLIEMAAAFIATFVLFVYFFVLLPALNVTWAIVVMIVPLLGVAGYVFMDAMQVWFARNRTVPSDQERGSATTEEVDTPAKVRRPLSMKNSTKESMKGSLHSRIHSRRRDGDFDDKVH